MNWRAVYWAALVVVGLGLGCEANDGVVEPIWNKQACSHCRMLLSEPRYAAQALTDTSERLYFDDVGCMASYLTKHSVRVRHTWVHDEAGHWVEAQHIRYRSGATTPMGYGYEPSAQGPLDFASLQRTLANAPRARETP